MALTLDPILKAAQDGLSHKPIVEIISMGTVADIPFDGQELQSTLTNEQKPNVITHSSGRLCLIYTFGGAFKYVYTDTSRTEFHFVDIAVPAGQTGVEACLCELADGNIGIVYYSTDSTNQILRRMVIDPTGAIVIAAANIQAYGVAHHILSAPFVVRLADGSYLLIYAHKNVDALTYSISKRTSADFLTWSAEGTCSIGGLTDTKRIDNPSLLQISTGQIWVWFDYLDDVSGPNELINIYYSISDDNGVTWSAATKHTNYGTYDTVGRHPFAFQKIADQMHLLFYEQKGAMHMDRTQAAYCGGANPMMASNITFDSVNRKLYVVNSYTSAGIKKLFCVFRVDVDTWTIDACWNSVTVPGFLPIYTDNSVDVFWNCHHGEGHLIPIAAQGTQKHVALLDGEADTITDFHFDDWPDKGIVRNVNWSPGGSAGGSGQEITHTWVDQASMRLYVCLIGRNNISELIFHIGYFDITEDIGSTGGYHSFVDVIKEMNQVSQIDLFGLADQGSIQILPDSDLIIVSMGFTWGVTGSFWAGRMRIYTLTNPTLYKDYRTTTHPNFPYHGIKKFALVGGKIYGDFSYDTIYSETTKRGLCVIDLASDNITFQRPTWTTVDEYYLYAIKATSDNRLIISAWNYGVTVYDIPTGTWTLYDNNSVPGLEPGPPPMDRYTIRDLAYDETNGLIFGGFAGVNSANSLFAFSIYGFIRQAVYQIGTYAAGWTWGALDEFVQGLGDYEAVVALNPSDQTMYAFWTEQAKSELSLKWDKEGSSLDLSPYLASGHEIATSRKIDGSPASLSFSVSDGYLFDPHNSASLFSIYLRKTRKLTLRMGEKISGTNYWQNQGTFFVKSTALFYEREQFPLMEVQAEDIRSFWEDATVLATASFSTTPKEVMEAILTSHAGLSAGDMDIPVLDGSSTLYHQWVEVQLKEMLDEIATRFGYFMRTTVDGKISCRKISNANSVDHIYSGNTKLVNFTPDDSYASNVNQVIVVGETHDLIDVLFAEEPIKKLSGTVGWWGGKKEIEVWYSDDHLRRCQAPRLDVILSVANFNFKLGGGSESIGTVRTDNLGCTVTIDVPNMVAILVATIAAIAALAYFCLGCDPKVLGYGGWCGWCIFVMTTLMGLCLNILGSLANYEYEVYAQPWGQVRQSIQGRWDNAELQAAMGFVAPQKVDDPLCYTVDQCTAVATYRGMVADLQRNRVTQTKLAHLQDEEGDTLQIDHPHSGMPMKIFVAGLTRRLQIPSSPTSGDGHFLDEIEGWKV